MLNSIRSLLVRVWNYPSPLYLFALLLLFLSAITGNYLLNILMVLCVARILCIVLTALASIAFTHYISRLP